MTSALLALPSHRVDPPRTVSERPDCLARQVSVLRTNFLCTKTKTGKNTAALLRVVLRHTLARASRPVSLLTKPSISRR